MFTSAGISLVKRRHGLNIGRENVMVLERWQRDCEEKTALPVLSDMPL